MPKFTQQGSQSMSIAFLIEFIAHCLSQQVAQVPSLT